MSLEPAHGNPMDGPDLEQNKSGPAGYAGAPRWLRWWLCLLLCLGLGFAGGRISYQTGYTSGELRHAFKLSTTHPVTQCGPWGTCDTPGRCWTHQPRFCAQYPTKSACSPSGFTWLDPSIPFLSGAAACQALAACGYKRLAFVGDSYIRHLMGGFMCVLSDDYQFGALQERGRLESCRGDLQFSEQSCRQYVPASTKMCGGNISIDLHHAPWPVIGPQHAAYDAVFWGGGRHPVDGNTKTRFGVHNATAVITHKLRPTCEAPQQRSWLKANRTTRPRLHWITDHARLFAYAPDERADVVMEYTKRTTAAAGTLCGAPVVDLYDHTHALLQQLPRDALNMTHDGNHWARTVNVISAHILLRHLMQACQACTGVVGNVSAATASAYCRSRATIPPHPS